MAKIGEEFTAAYRAIIPEIAPLINSIAKHIPKRRERVQHVGLFGYSRGVGGATLPRAIGFTAALYSIGVPPEFLGTAAGIAKGADVSYIEKFYINLCSDLTQAGKYLNKTNLNTSLGIRLQLWQSAWQSVTEKPVCGWGYNSIRESQTAQLARGEISGFIYGCKFNADNRFLDEMTK